MNQNNNAPCPAVPFVPFMPTNPVLARAYVPFQMRYYTYPIEEGFHKGTIFPELYRPYDGTLPKGGVPCGE